MQCCQPEAQTKKTFSVDSESLSSHCLAAPAANGVSKNTGEHSEGCMSASCNRPKNGSMKKMIAQLWISMFEAKSENLQEKTPYVYVPLERMSEKAIQQYKSLKLKSIDSDNCSNTSQNSSHPQRGRFRLNKHKVLSHIEKRLCSKLSESESEEHSSDSFESLEYNSSKNINKNVKTTSNNSSDKVILQESVVNYSNVDNKCQSKLEYSYNVQGGSLLHDVSNLGSVSDTFSERLEKTQNKNLCNIISSTSVSKIYNDYLLDSGKQSAVSDSLNKSSTETNYLKVKNSDTIKNNLVSVEKILSVGIDDCSTSSALSSTAENLTSISASIIKLPLCKNYSNVPESEIKTAFTAIYVTDSNIHINSAQQLPIDISLTVANSSNNICEDIGNIKAVEVLCENSEETNEIVTIKTNLGLNDNEISSSNKSENNQLSDLTLETSNVSDKENDKAVKQLHLDPTCTASSENITNNDESADRIMSKFGDEIHSEAPLVSDITTSTVLSISNRDINEINNGCSNAQNNVNLMPSVLKSSVMCENYDQVDDLTALQYVDASNRQSSKSVEELMQNAYAFASKKNIISTTCRKRENENFDSLGNKKQKLLDSFLDTDRAQDNEPSTDVAVDDGVSKLILNLREEYSNINTQKGKLVSIGKNIEEYENKQKTLYEQFDELYEIVEKRFEDIKLKLKQKLDYKKSEIELRCNELKTTQDKEKQVLKALIFNFENLKKKFVDCSIMGLPKESSEHNVCKEECNSEKHYVVDNSLRYSVPDNEKGSRDILGSILNEKISRGKISVVAEASISHFKNTFDVIDEHITSTEEIKEAHLKDTNIQSNVERSSAHSAKDSFIPVTSVQSHSNSSVLNKINSTIINSGIINQPTKVLNQSLNIGSLQPVPQMPLQADPLRNLLQQTEQIDSSQSHSPNSFAMFSDNQAHTNNRLQPTTQFSSQTQNSYGNITGRSHLTNAPQQVPSFYSSLSHASNSAGVSTGNSSHMISEPYNAQQFSHEPVAKNFIAATRNNTNKFMQVPQNSSYHPVCSSSAVGTPLSEHSAMSSHQVHPQWQASINAGTNINPSAMNNANYGRIHQPLQSNQPNIQNNLHCPNVNRQSLRPQAVLNNNNNNPQLRRLLSKNHLRQDNRMNVPPPPQHYVLPPMISTNVSGMPRQSFQQSGPTAPSGSQFVQTPMQFRTIRPRMSNSTPFSQSQSTRPIVLNSTAFSQPQFVRPIISNSAMFSQPQPTRPVAPNSTVFSQPRPTRPVVPNSTAFSQPQPKLNSSFMQNHSLNINADSGMNSTKTCFICGKDATLSCLCGVAYCSQVCSNKDSLRHSYSCTKNM